MSEYVPHELGGEIDERILGFVTRGELAACVQIDSTLFQTLGMVNKRQASGRGNTYRQLYSHIWDPSIRLRSLEPLPEVIQRLS